MKKVFLYLYPIEEYQKAIFRDDEFYIKDLGVKPPLPILEECIQKRYRDNGYEIVYAMYPDKDIEGLKPRPEDRIILSDVTFNQASGYRSDGSMKPIEEVKSADPKFLLDQIGDMDEIVVSGFHSGSCVEEIAEYAYSLGIETLIDLDLTERFEYKYRQQEFKMESYNPADVREKTIAIAILDREDMDRVNDALHQFSPVYHLFDESYKPSNTAQEIVEFEINKLEKENVIN